MSSTGAGAPSAGLSDLLHDPIGIVRRRWRPMLAVFVLGSLASLALVRVFAADRYVAEATVLVSRPPTDDPARERVGESDPVNAMLASALSAEHLARLIERYDLYRGLRNELSQGELVKRMRKHLTVREGEALEGGTRIGSSRLFTVTFRSERPDVAAGVANDAAVAFAEAGAETRNRQAELAAELLRDNLDDVEAQLAAREQAVSDFLEEHGAGVSEIAAKSAEEDLAAMRARLADVLAIYTNQHPNVRVLRAQVARLDARAAKIRALLDERSELERAAEDAREQVREAQARAEAAELARSLEAARAGEVAAVLDLAEPPSTPGRTRRGLAGVGVAASLGAALLLGLLLERRDPVLLGAERIEADFAVAVLGSVPRIS